MDAAPGKQDRTSLPRRDPWGARANFTWKRAATMCGRDAVQVRPPTPVTLDLAGLAGRLAPLGEVKIGPHALRLVMPPHELTVFRDGRAIVKGTSEIAVARSLYARLVGT